ncbi:MAG: glycine--tRNA ligase subunit beta, partial [Syntrophomonas sp.]
MNNDFVLEIGFEEIPSAYMPQVIEDLKTVARRKFAETRLEYDDMFTYGTPRRLTLYITGLNEQQGDSLIENRGPKKSLALDAGGNATKAGLGFARGQGVEFKDLEFREVAGIEYVFAVKKEKGISTEEILPIVLTGIIQALAFPKSMRWAYSSTRFARPIPMAKAIIFKRVVSMPDDSAAISFS